MEANKEVVEVLNDLIRINNDRIEGYEKAAKEIMDTADEEIKTLFFQMAEDSRQYRTDLINAVTRLGGEPADNTTASGKIYRTWMDVKATFSGDDVKAMLESCEYGEDAALKAYQEALQEEIAWPTDVSALVSNQRQKLRVSHDRIRSYRDQYRKVQA